MKVKLYFFLPFIVLVAPFVALNPAGQQPAGGDAQPERKAAQIDALVSRYAQLGYLNGSLLVADRGKVIYLKGVGEADMERHVPNTPQTKFGIASITKQFTAVLVLEQAAEGRIRLEGKLSEYLPWYRSDTGGRMTVEQLLHHTSGLPSDFNLPEFSDSKEASVHYEPRPFAEKFCQGALAAEPGTTWGYSNCGYILLGLILEQATGKPFTELLRERLLDPLNMKDSGMDRNDLVELGGATGYQRHAGPRYTLGPYEDRGHIFSAGAMYSTVEDLFRWDRALADEKFFPNEMRRQIFLPRLNQWAYGWFVTKIPAGQPGVETTQAEMRGDMPGNYFAWILRYPERDALIVVLRNGYGSTEGLEQNLQAILFNQPPRLPSRNAKDLIAQLWLKPTSWVASHRLAGILLIMIVFAGLWLLVRRYRTSF